MQRLQATNGMRLVIDGQSNMDLVADLCTGWQLFRTLHKARKSCSSLLSPLPDSRAAGMACRIYGLPNVRALLRLLSCIHHAAHEHVADNTDTH